MHDPTTCDVCPEGIGEPLGHGWQIQDVTHCRGCGATWRLATNTNHCVKCHLTFATLDAGYALHSDNGHKHPSTKGLVFEVNQWGTEVWGTQEGFDNARAKGERMRAMHREQQS